MFNSFESIETPIRCGMRTFSTLFSSLWTDFDPSCFSLTFGRILSRRMEVSKERGDDVCADVHLFSAPRST